MTIREKLLKGLEHCVHEEFIDEDDVCNGCPYEFSGANLCLDLMRQDMLQYLKEENKDDQNREH